MTFIAAYYAIALKRWPVVLGGSPAALWRSTLCMEIFLPLDGAELAETLRAEREIAEG